MGKAVIAEAEEGGAKVEDHGRAQRVGVGGHHLLREEIDISTGFGIVRIAGQVQVAPAGVASEHALLVADDVIEARIELIVVAAGAGIGGKVVDVGELLPRAVRKGPQASQDGSRLVESRRGN